MMFSCSASVHRGTRDTVRFRMSALTYNATVAFTLRHSMGPPYMPINWGGFGGQCRHIWHTWNVWDIQPCSMKTGQHVRAKNRAVRSLFWQELSYPAPDAVWRDSTFHFPSSRECTCFSVLCRCGLPVNLTSTEGSEAQSSHARQKQVHLQQSCLPPARRGVRNS